MNLMQKLMRHCFLVKILMKRKKKKTSDHGKDSHSDHIKRKSQNCFCTLYHSKTIMIVEKPLEKASLYYLPRAG